MKDFNIENLARKNAYKTPENFFDEVQKNVLDRVGKEEIKEEAKVIPLFNRWYLAAACIAVLAGGLFFTTSNFGASDEVQTLAQVKDSNSTDANVTEQNETTTVEEKNLITFVNDVESVMKEETKPVKTKVEEPVKRNTLASSSKAEFSHVEMEQFIESMSQEDISKITQNNNQDIYLDLYY